MSEEQPVYRTYSADAFGGTDKRKDATIAQQRELIAELVACSVRLLRWNGHDFEELRDIENNFRSLIGRAEDAK